MSTSKTEIAQMIHEKKAQRLFNNQNEHASSDSFSL